MTTFPQRDPRLANPVLLRLAAMRLKARQAHPPPAPDEAAIRECRPWSVWIGGHRIDVIYESPRRDVLRAPEG